MSKEKPAAKQTKQPQRVDTVKTECKLKKQHKVFMQTIYKGNMPKELRRMFGAPDQERYMMMHEVKRPGGYTGI